ncbi:MAG: tetratricopeptide repeat protein [Verrucomicrobiota bacterium]
MSRRSQKRAAAARFRAPVSPAGWTDRWTVPGVCLFLAAIIWLVFGQTLRDEFVYDDEDYVWGNPEVARGLTFQGIVWAFTHVHASNWHPLTWMSHMLDCQLYGLNPGGQLNPGGHHLTNVLFHTATAILLFLVLRRMTGFLWRSAFVAAVFAIHPLRVESVAWVSERKDVLSGVFFMLTLWAYMRYAQRRSKVEPSSLRFAAPGSRESGAGGGSLALDPRLWTFDYGLVLLFFALGLMSKPMLVTLPCVLLLLDYWPLHRVPADAATQPVFRLAGRLVPRRLVFEKLPLFGLAAASCAVTLFAQAGAIQPYRNMPHSLSVGNALNSYVTYVEQMFWPSGLAVLYPFRVDGVEVAGVALSLVVLAGISTIIFVLRRRRYLPVGWLWYLGMLVPVIGLIQVGGQARADRYTYLPQIGLYVLLTWAAADLCAGWRHRRVVSGGGATIVLLALIFCARAQAAYWRNSESLWTHTLACTSDNFTAHYNLGNTLIKKGKVNEAMAHYQMALQIKPDSVEALDGLGTALFQKGKVGEAISYYQRALEIEPDHVVAHVSLGNALFRKGNVAEAIAHYQRALQIKPDHVETQNNLALVLATCPQASLRNGKQAVALAQRANQLTGDANPAMLGTLAAAYAEVGRFPEAVETAQRALQLAESQSNAKVADALRSQLKFYQAGLPFHYPAQTPESGPH